MSTLAKPLDPQRCADIAASPRFIDKVQPDPDTGCHVWTASVDTSGYAQAHYNRFAGGPRLAHAHRLVLVARLGVDIPADWHVDHLCRNRRCVNPEHLEAVPERVNILRGIGASARNARKMICDRCAGQFSVLSVGDRRLCKQCQSEYGRRRRAAYWGAARRLGIPRAIYIEALGWSIPIARRVANGGVTLAELAQIAAIVDAREQSRRAQTCRKGLHVYDRTEHRQCPECKRVYVQRLNSGAAS